MPTANSDAQYSPSPTIEDVASIAPPPPEKPFSRQFFDEKNAIQRKIYFKIFFGGVMAVIIAIFAILSIYWGSLWKSPVRNFNGWVVDFDGGSIGQSVVQALTSAEVQAEGLITYTAVDASLFPNGLDDVANAVREEKTWVVVTINTGSTSRFESSIATPNAAYNGSEAITVFGNEARNENGYRIFTNPSVIATLDAVTQQFAVQTASQQASHSNLTGLLATSPQTLVTPIYYTINNVVPFDIPVYMILNGAREVSGLNRNLSLRSLIVTRFASSIGAYFIISLFYALLSVAFQVPFSRKFGHSGFLVFWMLNWVGMMAVGLALEALITILTPRFIPFFMIIWIIIDVSVCIYPIDVLPKIFYYGYAAPFYNVSRAVRTIVFGTKNTVGMNFGILLVWAAISCITLPLIQWYVRRKDIAARQALSPPVEGVSEKQSA
ncbi:hypothetical protein H0H92_001082 [Tricholoma furcatifolium]|nr:hypothetical protein H0H92_001082 [Tricholoma furcatifolium]